MKRQATLDLMFSGDLPEDQTKPAVIFRGTGARISSAEEAGYDEDVVVLWQPRGWQYAPTQMDWAERDVNAYMSRRRATWCEETGNPSEDAPYGFMVQHNLGSQCREEFVDYVEKECSMVVHFAEKSSSTHMRQAIDRGNWKDHQELDR